MYTDYVQLMSYVDQNIERGQAEGNEKRVKNFELLAGPMEEVFAEIADCETMIPVLEKLFSTSTDDIEKLTSILRLLERVDCTESNLFLPVATAVYRIILLLRPLLTLELGLRKIVKWILALSTSKRPLSAARTVLS